MSRRTKPKNPFRDRERQRVNAELATRVESRRRAMINLLRPRRVEHAGIEPTMDALRPGRFGGDGESIVGSIAKTAVEYACLNRAGRRRQLHERSDGHLIPGAATMAPTLKRQ